MKSCYRHMLQTLSSHVRTSSGVGPIYPLRRAIGHPDVLEMFVISFCLFKKGLPLKKGVRDAAQPTPTGFMKGVFRPSRSVVFVSVKF